MSHTEDEAAYGGAAGGGKTPNAEEGWRDEQTAMVLMGCYGSQSSLDEAWHGYGYHCDAFVPDGFGDQCPGSDWCHTVLHAGFSEPRVPAGYRLAVQFACGEHECPWCGPGTGEDDDGKGPEERRPDCKLCEGGGTLYWGENWSVCVFAPIDPDATLEAMRKLVAVRDNSGVMWNDQHGRELARLFADLDAYMTEGNEAPRGWQ